MDAKIEKLERTYVIPLRREWLKAPKYKRAKRAVSALRTFLVRHMKSEDIRLGTSVNLEIWKHGIKCPPGKVKVNVSRDDKGVVFAELFGAKVPQPKVEKEKKKLEVKTEVNAPKEAVKELPKEVKVAIKKEPVKETKKV